MDSGNIKSPAGLTTLTSDARGERGAQSGNSKTSDGGGFAALIASILSNARPAQAGGQAGVQAGNGAAVPGQAPAPDDVQALTAPEGVAGGPAALIQRIFLQAAPGGDMLKPGAAPKSDPPPAQAAASPLASSGGAGVASTLDRLLRGVPGQGAGAAALDPQAAGSARAAVAERAADRAGMAGAPSGAIEAALAGQDARAQAAGGHAAQPGGGQQAAQGAASGGDVFSLMNKGVASEGAPGDKSAIQGVDAKAGASGTGAPAGAEAPARAAEAASAARAVATPASGAQGVVQQVAQNLSFLAANGVDHLRFQLNPAEMGQVSVRLLVRKGATRVVISAEHPAALEAMRHAAGSLQQALQSAGLPVEREGLQFDLQDQGQQQFADADRDGEGRNDQLADQADGAPVSGDVDGDTGGDADEEGEPPAPGRRGGEGLFL